MNNRLAERVRDLWRRAIRRRQNDIADPIETPTLDLPFTNTHETCDLLKARLAELNRDDKLMEPRERLRHLEAFRDPVETVAERLHQMTQDITLPVRSSIVDTALGARTLYVELALGYKSVLNEICGQETEILDIDLPRLAVQGCFQALSNVLNLSYALYWPAPTGVWKELHQLYKFAARNQMVEPESEQTPESMATAYKKTLLLWLANPYGLTPNEQLAARQLVAQWGHLAQLSETALEDALFVVPAGDNPPVVSHWRPASDEIQLYLSTRKLCAELSRHEQGHMPPLLHAPPPPLDFNANAVAQRLTPDFLALWCGERSRRAERRHSAASRLVTIGLGSSHYYLSNRQSLGESAPNPTNAAPEAPAREAPTEPNVLPRSAVFRGKPSNEPSPYRIHSANMQRPAASLTISVDAGTGPWDSRIEHKPQPHHATATFGKFLCRVINDSNTGACLLIRGHAETSLRIGELISVFALGDEKYRAWGVGSIRWLRHFRGQYVMIGVERLVRHATAVATKVCDPSGRYSDYLRSLLVTDPVPGDRGPSGPTLITAHIPYRTGDTILMHHMGQEKRLILGPTVRRTARFRQFKFEDPDSVKLGHAISTNVAGL